MTPSVGPSPGVSAPADLMRPGGSTGTIRAAAFDIDLGGRIVTTWGYNGTLPGPEIRLRRGETLRVRLDNQLGDPTTIHWHGLNLPNAMDGVPDVTQPAVLPGGDFDYTFAAPDSGSFMYHAHVGHQLDFGLYGPLIVEEPDEPAAYDREYTLMLDDWRHGLTAGADDSETGTAHASHEPETASPAAGSNAGPPMGARTYPLYLVNGRTASDPATVEVRRGERVRLRVMNIAADTGFLFAIAGHSLTVTHADGMPVAPVIVDVIRLGMGERYDVVVEADNPGAWQIAVLPEAKRGLGRAVLRYADSPSAAAPPPDMRPPEFQGRLLAYADLRYTGTRTFDGGEPDRVHDIVLTTNRINGRRYPDAEPFAVAPGELVRFTLRNDSAMWHPMHMHGHHFLVRNGGSPGPVKDTLTVAGDGGTATFDLLATNPGAWMFHCHNPEFRSSWARDRPESVG